MKKATRIYVFGIVQGVFFRNFIKDSADKLDIKGYVRNKEDGSVEAWLEGESEKVNKMVEMCQKGPEHAVIKRLDIVEEKVQDMKEFKVLSI
ncbi:acylphosphatase [Candidatus Pacearchaeota archaeon]|nr:acylphosphatase [Candidatus Pacearchaeota archaeon]